MDLYVFPVNLQGKESVNKDKLDDKERELRKKLVKKYKTAHEQQLEEQKEKLLKTIEGKNKLRSVLASSCKKTDDEDDENQSSESSDSSSDGSSSSESSDFASTSERRETSWKGEYKQHFLFVCRVFENRILR